MTTQQASSGCASLVNTNYEENIEVVLGDDGSGVKALIIRIRVEFDLLAPDPEVYYSLANIEYDLAHSKIGATTDSLCGGLQSAVSFYLLDSVLLDENLVPYEIYPACSEAAWRGGTGNVCQDPLQTLESSWGRLKSYYR